MLSQGSTSVTTSLLVGLSVGPRLRHKELGASIATRRLVQGCILNALASRCSGAHLKSVECAKYQITVSSSQKLRRTLNELLEFHSPVKMRLHCHVSSVIELESLHQARFKLGQD